MSFEPASTWVGVGEKTGVSLGPGVEQTLGVIWNCNDYRYTFLRINSLRIGVGAGACIGGVLVLVFNAPHPGSINNLDTSGWTVNLPLADTLRSISRVMSRPQIWGSVLKAIRAVNHSRVGRTLSHAGIRAVSRADLDNFRELASIIGDAHGAYQSSETTIMVLDIPLAGLGTEISVSWSMGRAEIF